MKIVMVYITVSDKAEARKIGRYLVESKLAACVNIFNDMNSMYVWQEQFQDDQEAVIIAKTTENKVRQLIEGVKAKHSYECPCIVTFPIADGNPGFLDWIVEQVETTSNDASRK